MRILLIILIFFIQNFAHSKEFKWKRVDQTEHENYYEIIGKGKRGEHKFTAREFFPKSTKTTKKEGMCKEWRVEEVTLNEKYVWKKYALNDCLPCIDEGSGHICSYPYFVVNYQYGLFGKWDSNSSHYSRLEDITDDGAKAVSITVNLGSREQVEFHEKTLSLDSLNVKASFFSSQIIKYNTRLRKIVSEKSKGKTVKESKFRLVFDRIKYKTLEHINNKTKLNLREKDLRVLFSVEPSATITKYQTRD